MYRLVIQFPPDSGVDDLLIIHGTLNDLIRLLDFARFPSGSSFKFSEL